LPVLGRKNSNLLKDYGSDISNYSLEGAAFTFNGSSFFLLILKKIAVMAVNISEKPRVKPKVASEFVRFSLSFIPHRLRVVYVKITRIIKVITVPIINLIFFPQKQF
jgi:hypothetical protein